jgi:hypothetical protein
MPEPTTVTVMSLIAGAISVTEKILDKTESPAEKERSDLAELKANFNSYKQLPVHKRVNSYLWNMFKEIQTLQLKIADKL